MRGRERKKTTQRRRKFGMAMAMASPTLCIRVAESTFQTTNQTQTKGRRAVTKEKGDLSSSLPHL